MAVRRRISRRTSEGTVLIGHGGGLSPGINGGAGEIAREEKEAIRSGKGVAEVVETGRGPSNE